MIYVTIKGRLTKDSKKSKDGKSRLLSVACNDKQHEMEFVKYYNVVVAKDTKLILDGDVVKGAFVELSGNVRLDSFTKDNGEVVATETVFADKLHVYAPLKKEQETDDTECKEDERLPF